MSKKSTILNEDSQNIYNKWVSGIAKKEAPSEVITVDDIINRYRNNSNYQATKSIPYPITLLLDFLGNIFIKTAELRHTLGNAVTYPLFKKSKEKIEAIKKLNEKLKQIQEIIYSCAEDLNSLVDKSEK
jgi:hypothetical protein